ncbi:MAG TPA: hypothetical protein VNX68_13915, partial [Nitrosopumilaceae archaeon]|nr:hypothetical protein [Nitrosopumilaceae archaeon]
MEKKQYIKCNHCNFVTNDIQNKSGILKKHLESDHPNSTNKSNTLTHFTLKETHKDNDIKKIIFKPYIQDFYNKLKQLPLCFIYKIKEEYKLGTSGERILANKYRTTRNVVKQILKLTNIEKNNYGRLYEGGKNEADKRYYNKNKENIQQYHKDWYNENYYNGNLKEKQDKYRENNIERYRKNSRE